MIHYWWILTLFPHVFNGHVAKSSEMAEVLERIESTCTYSLSSDAVIVSTPSSLLISVGLISAKIVSRALP